MISVVTPAGQAEGEDETETVVTGLFSTPTVGAFKLKGKKREKLRRLTVPVIPRGQTSEEALGPHALPCGVYAVPLLCIRG